MRSCSLSARTPLGFALLALAAVLASGCGAKKQIPVTGKVLLDGKAITPAKGETASVNYHPETPGSPLGIGPVDETGTYTIAGGKQPGLKPGIYKVTVTYTRPGDPKDPYSVPVRLINEKYADPKFSDLKIEVKAGAPPGAYDLKVTK